MSENYNANEADPVGANASHIFRYYFARGYVEPNDKVLDLACGWGYGSHILSRQASSVIGMDYREDCINHAKNKYPHISFERQDLNQIESLPEADLSVSIETIEHLKDPKRFADILKTNTRRTIVISTPIIKTTETNKDHLHNFTPQSLQALFNDNEWQIIHWANLGNVYGLFAFANKETWHQN